jgi:hypothetical protein
MALHCSPHLVALLLTLAAMGCPEMMKALTGYSKESWSLPTFPGL